MIRFFTALLISFAALLAGCGSGGGGGGGSFGLAPGTGSLVIGSSGLAAMPQANCANLSITVDGASTVMNISTPCTTATAVGTFVGGGSGNKAIVQFDGFDGLKVSDLASVELDARSIVNTSGTQLFYMNFVVDLDCVKDEVPASLQIGQMRDRRKIVVWQPNAVAGVVQPDGYTRYSATPSTNQWGIVRGATPTFGMANHIDANGPLGIAGFPNACIVDGVSADGGLLRDRSAAVSCATATGLGAGDPAICGLASKGVLLLLGDSGNFANRSFNVKRLKIKDRVITFQ
ncbi:MAG: hypothetical protein EAZ37_09185 [Burkholderiales bacterium]|nr:MAG: hypothetical protein EAZ37_09185 [Burkholderiales bacterium]